MLTITAASTAAKAVCPTKGGRRIGFLCVTQKAGNQCQLLYQGKKSHPPSCGATSIDTSRAKPTVKNVRLTTRVLLELDNRINHVARMAVDSASVHCAACGAILDENPSAPVDERLPCPQCGSFSRSIHVSCSDTLTFHSKLNLKARHSGEKRPFMDQTVGDDLHRNSGHWMKLYRLIDRVKDWYYERVTSPATGEIVHECSEPLTNHRDHGSAKAKN